MESVRFEKIVIVGVDGSWEEKKTVDVEVEGETHQAEVEFQAGEKGKANVVVIRDPKAPLGKDWVVKF